MNLQRNAQPLTSSRDGLHRCFFAVRFSQEMTAALDAIISTLRAHGADIRWTSPRNLHLTLRFLGEITNAQLADAREQMEQASGFLPFTLGAFGLGAFPTLRAPRILWAGVACVSDEDRARLDKLQHYTERWARALGLAPEGRRFTPHITLGRVARASHGLRAVVDDITTREFSSETCTIEEVVLMRSLLLHDGPRYEAVKTVRYTGVEK